MASSNSTDSGVGVALNHQWANPSDILSLLLIVGGDIVQKAIAQLHGLSSSPFLYGRRVGFTPVAFSFGWVAFVFSSLTCAVGENRLMPAPDCPSIVVNCANAFIKPNMSWILGRILRDHEIKYELDPSKVSIRIDIFELRDDISHPKFDLVWWSGVLTIIIQIFGFGIVGWVKWNDWSTMAITLLGTALALLTASIPQWADEKWSGALLDRSPRRKTAGEMEAGEMSRKQKHKTVALTRGNGSHHVMIIRGRGHVWDLESLASAAPRARKETSYMLCLLALGWTVLLISTSGLKSHNWLLLGVGGLGMLQNVYAAGARRDPSAFNIHLRKAKNGTIIGKRPPRKEPDDGATKPKHIQVHLKNESSDEGDIEDSDHRLTTQERDEIKGDVMDVLIELENREPKAGIALLEVFFPGGLVYKGEKFRTNSPGKRDKRAFKALFRRIGRPVPSHKTHVPSGKR
jgi:hypothetical protein